MPLSTLRGAPTPGVWTERDRLAALALQAYEDDLCPAGHPLSWTADPDVPAAAYTDEHVTCAACAATELAARRRRDADPAPGAMHYARPGEWMTWVLQHPHPSQWGGPVKPEHTDD